MYKIPKAPKNKIIQNRSYVGDSIEIKVMKITQQKEPIKDGAPLRYTDRSEGVQPAHDVRTDRWDKALEATDSITAGRRAKREQKMGEKAKENMKKEDENSKPDQAGNPESKA